ncbi:MAG TPA: hypothetical protein VFT43_03685 [Candidatus Polarisedimenticolia bacterium]|nr:hypothetical protein [Candidatus Polarisedimenticolia bacterium]
MMLLVGSPARALTREALKDLRGRYEGMSLRLRVDLKPDVGAKAPNVVSLDGVGYAREGAPALFGRLEIVYLERITGEGGTRVGLTLYRSQEEARRLRASAIPPPAMGANPNYGRTIAAFARQGSTTVLLELKASRKEPERQAEEVETLLDRLFYLKSEPTQDDLEEFVRQHRGLSIQELHAITGLDSETIRALLRPPPAPATTP